MDPYQGALRPSDLYPPRPGQPAELLRDPQLAYVGTPMDLLGVVLKNLLLTLVTVGIYYPWAKTAVRRYIWSNVSFGGSTLQYSGTGKELFLGYLRFFAIVLASVVLFWVLFEVSGLLTGGSSGLEFSDIAPLAIYPVLIFIIPFAIFGSRRYRLSRTKWRGIRLGLEGRAFDFARLFWKSALLVAVTLGIMSPYMSHWMRQHLTRASRLGTEPLDYDGEGGAMMWMAIKAVLLSIPTLGLYTFWYQAERTRYILSHTRLQGGCLACNLRGSQLFAIALVGIVALPLTLGLAYPWYATWQMQVLLGSVSFEGDIDLERIERGLAARGGAAADGAADFLEADFGL